MKPEMIHAVVSPTNSAIGSWEFVDADMRAGLQCVLDLIRSRAKQLTDGDRQENIYNGLVYGRNLWICLAEILTDAGNEDVKHWVVQIQIFLD